MGVFNKSRKFSSVLTHPSVLFCLCVCTRMCFVLFCFQKGLSSCGQPLACLPSSQRAVLEAMRSHSAHHRRAEGFLPLPPNSLGRLLLLTLTATLKTRINVLTARQTPPPPRMTDYAEIPYPALEQTAVACLPFQSPWLFFMQKQGV